MSHSRKQLLVITCALILLTISAQAQTQRAKDWFTRAVNERDAAPKIEALLKAVAEDPLYTEAYFRLGLSYTSINDYTKAEAALRKAESQMGSASDKKLKMQIVEELGAIYLRTGRLADALEKFRIAKSLSEERKDKARAAFAIGRAYAAMGQENAALREFGEARRLDTALTARVNSFIKLLDSNTLVAETEARNQDKLVEALYQQALKYESAGQLAPALTTFQTINAKTPGYKDVEARAARINTRIQNEEKQKNLQTFYRQGVAALRGKKWLEAIIAFKKVINLDRRYRDAAKKLSNAENALFRAKTDAALKQYYIDGVAAIEREDFRDALALLEKVNALNPSYRDTQKLVSQLEQKLQIDAQTKRVKSGRKTSISQADILYGQAILQLKQKEWHAAIQTLNNLQAIEPGYRNTLNYLLEAESRLAGATSSIDEAVAQPEIFGFSYEVIAAIAILPLLAIWLLSPKSRARVYTRLGIYSRAIAIYERTLVKHPGQANLYIKLSDLYLSVGRRDATAMNIFNAVVSMKLSTNNWLKINELVALNAPAKNEADLTLQELEKALEDEKKRMDDQ